MINIQELIIHLQKKITEYRYQQKRTAKAKSDILTGRHLLSQLATQLHDQLLSLFKVYRSQMTTEVAGIAEFFQQMLARVRNSHEEEVMQLRSEIERQHKVITTMRKEVEDLQELMIMQSAAAEREPQTPTVNTEEKGENNVSPQGRTFGDLEVIQEQTERTLLSSARSNHEQRCNMDAFIRIQEQQEQQLCFQKQALPEFRLSNCDRPPSNRTHSESSSPSDWPSQEQAGISKLEQMMELSHFSQRQHSLGQDPFPQYQSLPLSMQDYFQPQLVQECHTWGGEEELKDITNSRADSEQQRQSRSKMFLEEFRRTFNKCLTSNPSRKGSTKDSKSSNKNSSREEGRQNRGEKGEKVGQGQGQRDSQRLISQMLKDIDNNNKFCVGSRKSEVRYEGGRRGGCRQGQGTLYYSNGLSYEGEFRGNQRHGYGILRFNQIQIYRGQWQADELSGQGKIRNFAVINRKKSQSGNSSLLKWVSYCGYFRSNRFEGEGTLYLQGGEKFLGRFICGAACGQGTLYRKNGQVQTGIWRNNQLVETF